MRFNRNDAVRIFEKPHQALFFMPDGTVWCELSYNVKPAVYQVTSCVLAPAGLINSGYVERAVLTDKDLGFDD